MKTLASLFIGLCLAHAASAEVIVYKHKINVTKTGSGTVKKLSVTGFFVIETGTNVGFIMVDPSRKRFEVMSGNPTIIGVPTTGKVDVTAFSIGYNDGVGGLVASGKNTALFDGVLTTIQAPKTLKVTGSGVDSAAGEFFLNDYKGAASYSSETTQNFNDLFYSVSQSVQALRTQLVAQGLTEADIGL